MTNVPPPEPPSTPQAPVTSLEAPPPGRGGLILLAWLWVGLPLAYGIYELVGKVVQLFTG
jgi:hypothetical protein